MSRRIFFVAGMHRCGTSYLAQALSMLGLELPISIRAGAPDNPKGHFEPFQIVQYHDSLLGGIGLSWDTFISPQEEWFSSEYADQAVADLSDSIRSDYPGAGPIVLKDPRLSLLLPLWKKITVKMGLQDFYVIPLRHPFEVAASLDKRNKISKNRALLIWLNYLFDVERYSRRSKRSFLLFPQWTQDSEQVLSRIEHNLGTRLPNKNKRNLILIKKEYEEALIHNKEPRTTILNNDIERLALDTFNCFLQLTTDPNDTVALSGIDQYRVKFNDLSAMFDEIRIEYQLKQKNDIQKWTKSEGRAIELEQQVQTSREEFERATARAEAIQQQLTESEGRAKELEQQVQTSREKFERATARAEVIQQQLTESEGRANELEQQVQTSHEEAEQVTARADAIQQQLTESEVRAKELEQQVQTSHEEAEQATARADAIQQQLTESEGRALELEQHVQTSHEEAEQATARADAIQQQLTESEVRAKELEQQVQTSHEEFECATAQADAIQQQLTESEGRALELEQQVQTSHEEAEQATARADAIQQQLTESEGRALELEQQVQTSHEEAEQATARADAIQQQLTESEGRALELEQQVQTSHEEAEQATARADAIQQQLTESEGRSAQLERQVQIEVKSNQNLQSELNDLKVLNQALSKEYEQLMQEYNREKLTVIEPIYRNIYKLTGLALRHTLPCTWVESLKKFVPNPNGIPKRLTYKPHLSGQFVSPSDLFIGENINSSPDVFVLSIINWDFRFQRPQHIAKGLADAGRRVFYVEMDLAEGKVELSKASENLYRARLSSKDIGHIQPYTGKPAPEQLEKWIADFYQLCDAVSSTAHKQIIIQHPFWWQLARHLPPEFQIIFDCMDDISGFSNTEQFLLDLEHDLLTSCDSLVVSSQHLYEKYKHYKTPVLIRNAAELTHFAKPKKMFVRPKFLEQHLVSNSANRIKVGYVGAIAEWFDADLIREVADNEPMFEFHLCGAVTANEPAQLDQHENIYMHGEISYSDVPGFLNEMDLLIIPFKIIPIIQACDPVKFYEYSAIGKPTVTTALPELSRASELTFVASTASEFISQIHNAYKKSKQLAFRKQLQEYAANNTWHHRTEQFVKLLEDLPRVSVVILSYGNPELTKSTLHSLYERGPSYPNLETIIVDNGSPSDALKDIRIFADKYTKVKIIENGKNLGFAKGNNVGLEAATGEYVMLLNNDTVVAPGSIYSLVRHLALNPAIGAVGPLTNNIGNEAKLFVEYDNMEQMRSVARSATIGYRGVYTPIAVVAYFAVMFRRRDLKIFGMLSEDYGRGMFEDDDHCAMIKSKGYICALAEDAYIHHHLSATFSTLKDEEKEKLFNKNKKIFEARWGAWVAHRYRKDRPLSALMKRG